MLDYSSNSAFLVTGTADSLPPPQYRNHTPYVLSTPCAMQYHHHAVLIHLQRRRGTRNLQTKGVGKHPILRSLRTNTILLSTMLLRQGLPHHSDFGRPWCKAASIDSTCPMLPEGETLNSTVANSYPCKWAAMSLVFCLRKFYLEQYQP